VRETRGGVGSHNNTRDVLIAVPFGKHRATTDSFFLADGQMVSDIGKVMITCSSQDDDVTVAASLGAWRQDARI
jgi:hypothetical protein